MTNTLSQIIPASAKKIGSGTKDIWDTEEVTEGVEEEAEETRPQPHYDMCYKQNVATEDVFLGEMVFTVSSEYLYTSKDPPLSHPSLLSPLQNPVIYLT